MGIEENVLNYEIEPFKLTELERHYLYEYENLVDLPLAGKILFFQQNYVFMVKGALGSVHYKYLRNLVKEWKNESPKYRYCVI